MFNILIIIITIILVILMVIMLICKISIEKDKKKGILFKSKDLVYIKGYDDLLEEQGARVILTLHFKKIVFEFENKKYKKEYRLSSIKEVKHYTKEELVNAINNKEVKIGKNFNKKLLSWKKYIIFTIKEDKEETILYGSSLPELISGTIEKAKKQI